MASTAEVARQKKWEAEEDARVLARAEEIKKKPTRLNAAKKQAKIMAADQEAQAKAMKKVAGGSGSGPAKRKPVRKKK